MSGGADFNFYGGHFRVYGGPAHGDRIIAKRAMTADLWTHVAVSRDETGRFRIYLDGELDNADGKPLKERSRTWPSAESRLPRSALAPPWPNTGFGIAAAPPTKSAPTSTAASKAKRFPRAWRDTSRAAAPGATQRWRPDRAHARSSAHPHRH